MKFHNTFSENEIEIIKKIYPLCSKEEILHALPNRDYGTIKWKAKQLGVKKKRAVQVKTDLSILLEDCCETYYWIGFLMADGYINHKQWRLIFSLHHTDEESIKKFTEYIKSKNVNYYTSNYILKKSNKKTSKKMCTTTACDKFIIPKIVQKYDFKPQKTYNPPVLSYLDNNFDYFLSFLIGFIDGDGCITVLKPKQSSLCGISISIHKNWKNNLLYIGKKLYAHLGLNMNKLLQDDSCIILKFNSICSIFLKKKAKELQLPVLQRKWDKIDEHHISKAEIGKINKSNIEKLLNKNLTLKEIALELNLTYACVQSATKRLMKNNK